MNHDILSALKSHQFVALYNKMVQISMEDTVNIIERKNLFRSGQMSFDEFEKWMQSISKEQELTTIVNETLEELPVQEKDV